MKHLSNGLKIILNALAAQYVGDYLSDEDKQATLQQTLAGIEREKNSRQDGPPPLPSTTTIRRPPRLALLTQ